VEYFSGFLSKRCNNLRAANLISESLFDEVLIFSNSSNVIEETAIS
jgi:hypothetical protein